jgi:hypothetical protein
MNDLDQLRPELERLQRRSLAVGLVGLVLCAGGAWHGPGQFFQSYLPAYLFWIGISLGCLAIVMLHHLVGGGWGLPVRRLLEAGSGTMLLMAVLFLPLLFGLRDLYVWARPQAVAADPLLQHKSLYLNVPAFVIRTVGYFVVWIGIAHLLNKWSGQQDQTAEAALTRRLQSLSGPGLVLYGLTVTFASIDWVMSLEPHWHSTIYGLVFVAGYGLEGVAFAIIMAHLLARRGPLAAVALPARFHDLGNLTLTFVLLWTYMAFAQFLIVWAENLTDEIPWYLHRTMGGWQGIALVLILLQFALPFALLLSRATKRRSTVLSLVAGLILCMRLVDLFWLVVPAFHPMRLHVHWMDGVAPIGIGGIWLAVFMRNLKGKPLVPLHDPRLVAAAEHSGAA